MKRLDLKSLLRIEWIGLGIVLIGATVIYALLIHPSLASFAALPTARGERETAVQELLEIRRQHQSLLNQIAAQKRQLESLGGSPPSLRDKENQIARVTRIATECGLTVDQYSPIGDLDTPEYSAVFIAFSGRGSYPSVRQFFRRVETDLDYVDVTHFTLTSSPNPATPAEPVCVLTLSCKLSGMPRATEESAPQASPPGAEPVEVVFHEP